MPIYRVTTRSKGDQYEDIEAGSEEEAKELSYAHPDERVVVP